MMAIRFTLLNLGEMVMKYRYLSKVLISFMLIFSLMFTYVSASSDVDIQNDRAKALHSLGILKGYPDGSLGLGDKIKRSEFFTMVVRILGLENSDVSGGELPFKDIDKSHWAYNNIKIAYKHGLIAGNPDGTIAPNNYITYPEVLTVLVRALGYEEPKEGKWPDRIINLSGNLGMTKDVNIPANKQVTRGEASVIIYNTLTVNFK
ncbi:hypothetical protein CDQ84_09655 [Clostridium thermosuccinogenes]|jgi:hypothetical protein|uniref:SLH domain-containing protein n=2 Tax=Clostridium thermosuccinogenes TaxID=84032 RepID=A0A2K2FE63_9CLOT|nr:hypothetical protein CDO33_19680 [Pseudoclostridium thermosuccinogenes]PNT97067.1 hypothetical protein CDQ85_09505 [Pseudoclostridium thermosuccinogenes]PNT98998.1 hypothetical protein CDQ84_09655 [Pseudoclostridium thermosuccinogenes]